MGQVQGYLQGLTGETIQETTQRPTHTTAIEHELCLLCLTKHQRERQSVCTCKHCSFPLCFDCMEDHSNELPQNVTQLTEQFNELEQLFQSKQNMVREESSKSLEEIKHCIKTCQKKLTDKHEEIRDDIAHAKQDAERYLNKIQSELEAMSGDIKALAAEPIFQPRRMETLLAQLNQIQEKLQTYEMKKDAELEIVMPKYKLQFQCIPTSVTDTTESVPSESSNPQNNTKRKRSSNKQTYHPHAKISGNGRTRNTLSNNDDTDSS